MPVSPIQTRFDGGEVSRRVGGRFDSEVYKKSLDLCTNFKPTPQGSLLMRAGLKHGAAWGTATPPKLFSFRVAGDSDDHTIAIDEDGLRIFDSNHQEVTRFENMISNSGFDLKTAPWAGLNGWPLPYPGGSVASSSGTFSGDSDDGWFSIPHGWAASYALALTVGHTYKITAKAKRVVTGVIPDGAISYAFLGVLGGGDPGVSFEIDASVSKISYQFTAIAGMTAVVLGAGRTMGSPDWFEFTRFDDVSVYDIDSGAVAPFVSPWTNDQLDAVQLAPEPHKDVGMFFHTKVVPRVIKLVAPGVWELYQAEFKSPPEAWGEGNWPGAAELGFQGRLFAGSTPNEPGLVWGSKVGSSFDFTTGATPDDAVSFTISTKGRIVWLQGQKTLLAGGEQAEHSVSGSNLLISSGDVNIQDESAYGSAPIQGVHIGNQVIFVAKDRRTVRALEYSQEANGWITKALTFLADHMTVGGIRELHFAHSPDPMLIAVLNLGGVVGCVYDRSEQVIAWWRLTTSGPVRSATIHHGDDGASVVCSVTRPTGVHLEHIPLHEVGAQYLDSWAQRTVRIDGMVTNCAHLAGQTVRCLIDGMLLGSITFDGTGQAPVGEEHANKTAVVGIPYTATARLLPRNLKTGKAHSPKIGAILNESAIPKINGKRAAERSAAVNFDTINTSYTGKCVVANMGWSEDDKITIEQDLPFRTEILAVFSRTEANEE